MTEKKKQDPPPEIDAFTRICDMAKVHFVDYLVVARIKTKDSSHFTFATSDQTWSDGALNRVRDMMLQSEMEPENEKDT